MEETLTRWIPYVDGKYIDKMKLFFKDVYNNKETGKILIIKGKEKTGKTTFVSEIIDLLGHKQIGHIEDNKDKNKQLLFVSEPHINSNKFSNNQIENIKSKLEEKKSLIMICIDIDIPEDIEKYCEIIEFTHSFHKK